MQLSQMAVGVTVCIATFYFKYTGQACDVKDDNLFWGYAPAWVFLFRYARFETRHLTCLLTLQPL